MWDRRSILLGGALTALSSTVGRAQQTEAGPPLPNPAAFQSGDFLWPKKPGQFVPYKYNSNNAFDVDEREWRKERDVFIQTVKRSPSYFKSADIQNLEKLTYREFYARYAGDQKPGVPGLYSSGGGIYVGHVGILEIDSSGRPWVVEALWAKGVVRSSYADWIRGRPGEIVWHGRLRDISVVDRERVMLEAKKYLSRPYDFWNFDLNNDVGFYCSKLVWLSIWRALNFAVDGYPEPKRTFWFSPKQLLYSKTITRLHDPGAYANG